MSVVTDAKLLSGWGDRKDSGRQWGPPRSRMIPRRAPGGTAEPGWSGSSPSHSRIPAAPFSFPAVPARPTCLPASLLGVLAPTPHLTAHLSARNSSTAPSTRLAVPLSLPFCSSHPLVLPPASGTIRTVSCGFQGSDLGMTGKGLILRGPRCRKLGFEHESDCTPHSSAFHIARDGGTAAWTQPPFIPQLEKEGNLDTKHDGLWGQQPETKA